MLQCTLTRAMQYAVSFPAVNFQSQYSLTLPSRATILVALYNVQCTYEKHFNAMCSVAVAAAAEEVDGEVLVLKF